MADDLHYGDLRVIAWQDWVAGRARLRSQLTQGAFDDSSSPPAPPGLQDESLAGLVVIAWQDTLVSRARAATQYAGAFDDSAVAPPPPQSDTAHWQQPRLLRRAWIRTPYLNQPIPWDGDGPAPPPPTPDFPPPNLTVIAWQDSLAPRARLRTQFTDAPQDLDGFSNPTPDQSLVVIAWFPGRVPMERARTVYWSPIAEPQEAAQSETLNSYTWGRGWHPSRFNPRAKIGLLYINTAQDASSSPSTAHATYIPTYRPRRR